MTDRWRRIKSRAAVWLESDSILFHYQLFLTAMFLWGVFALFKFSPTAVSEERSSVAYQFWVAWHCLAPAAVWGGMLIRNYKAKWRLRAAGDSALAVMILQHIDALIPQAQADATSAVYLLFIMVAMEVSALRLTSRDLLKTFRCAPQKRTTNELA